MGGGGGGGGGGGLHAYSYLEFGRAKFLKTFLFSCFMISKPCSRTIYTRNYVIQYQELLLKNKATDKLLSRSKTRLKTITM